MAVLQEAPRHVGIDLGLLSGEHQQLLASPAYRVVELRFDFLGRVQMGLVSRERAVLAIATTSP